MKIMATLNKKEYNKLVKMLYDNADDELKRILKRQIQIRGKILSEIGNILLIYSIDNNVMAMTKEEQEKEMEKLGKITKQYIQSGARTQIAIITALLGKNIEEQYKFYNYNADKKDIKKIVAEHYKGKHFSDRVWENETEVARQINKHINDFVVGKIDVNDIKHIIMTDFNNGAYNTKRLVNTEVARVQDRAFTRFGEEVGIKYVRYNSELDSKTCDDCQQYDGKVFAFNNKIETPKHPMCRCYYEIVDDEYKGKVETNFKNDKYYEKK